MIELFRRRIAWCYDLEVGILEIERMGHADNQ